MHPSFLLQNNAVRGWDTDSYDGSINSADLGDWVGDDFHVMEFNTIIPAFNDNPPVAVPPMHPQAAAYVQFLLNKIHILETAVYAHQAQLTIERAVSQDLRAYNASMYARLHQNSANTTADSIEPDVQLVEYD